MWKCSSYAGMMELVDMRDLGSRVAIRWGSSPHARTKKSEPNLLSCRWVRIVCFFLHTTELLFSASKMKPFI